MYNNFGKAVKELRTKQKLTITDFIKKLNVDISGTYISKIETKGEIPRPELICRIADLFGIEPKALLEIALKDKIDQFSAMWNRKYIDAAAQYMKKHK